MKDGTAQALGLSRRVLESPCTAHAAHATEGRRDNELMHPPIEVIDLAEKHSQEVARFSLAGLDEARKRAHALLVLLLAGGGALGGLGLARLADVPTLAAAALAGAVHWFALAAYVAWRASTTAPVRSWATPELVNGYDKWLAYAHTANAEAVALGGSAHGVDALQELRMEAVRNCEHAAREYRAASGAAYAVVDRAYRLAACMPVSAAAAAALVAWAGLGV